VKPLGPLSVDWGNVNTEIKRRATAMKWYLVGKKVKGEAVLIYAIEGL
jgi:hypothetical protein